MVVLFLSWIVVLFNKVCVSKDREGCVWVNFVKLEFVIMVLI